MTKPQNLILAIFGASGDLTARKLIPALYNLFLQKLLPDGFLVLGIGRTGLTDSTFRDKLRNDLIKINIGKEEAQISAFLEKLFIESLDPSDAGE